MLSLNELVPAQANCKEVIVPAAKDDFAAVAKNQFITFFQNKGFNCVADAQQQLKATDNKLTVRFSVSDARIAYDQGHAICYLSFVPLNKRYKIAVRSTGKTYAYTLLEDIFARNATARQKESSFSSLEELLNVVLPKTTSIAGTTMLQSFFSFLF